VFYANRYPEAKIISVEPERSNFEMLKKNTALYPNIVAVQAALWKESAQLTIFDPGLDHEGFRTSGGQECAASETRGLVSGVTVNKLMDDFSLGQIDLLKIDIEGSEKEVFECSSSWIDRVGMIAIELHDRFKAGCGQSVHLAARAFEFEWSVGETTFLVRKEYAGSPSSTGAYSSHTKPELPLKIDWAGSKESS
jgi:FkbM family methyltransferase